MLVVEDEAIIRDALGPLLQEEGYEVSFSENGRDALSRLYAETLPSIIVLDLRMPVMDGWQFRSIQKEDPKLGTIPVVVLSADGSAQAAAICAEAYLRKPLDPNALLTTVEHVLFESEQRVSARLDEAERLTALGRLAANVGHEINNPLAFVTLNLTQSLEELRPAIAALATPLGTTLSEFEVAEVKARLAGVVDMLVDSEAGAERIRETVGNLQRLSRQDDGRRVALDIHQVVEQAVSTAWNQIRHRARLSRRFGDVPSLRGNGAALGQVLVNLLVNAVHAIPEGAADENEISISTKVFDGGGGAELMVEIGDSGTGIDPEVLQHVFEPFFTTKPIGQGTGLGLSISRQAVRDHGGRITVESEVGKGTIFRVFLPLARPSSSRRGKVLVIDDERLFGRVIEAALEREHDVIVVQRASEALHRLELGESFDLVLGHMVMSDSSGPELHAVLAERWPEVAPRLVFMTGGAFAFMELMPTPVLSTPFQLEDLRRLVDELLHPPR